jgi:plastocyanin
VDSALRPGGSRVDLPHCDGARDSAQRHRFVPAQTIARTGDTLRFINGSGGPHNIQFLVDSLPESARDLLERAMPGEKIGPVASPLLLDQQETYQFAVPDLPPGRYPYVCLPHGANGMRGAIVIVL